ncbi:MAG: type 1 fimbrial protein [Symbiopectobacterium sp.]|uniref:type 1 fimbrial protein n=1 Tax=Symbiopectobacterium sp. TaxID=2952789 RepID=UPI0039ECF115
MRAWFLYGALLSLASFSLPTTIASPPINSGVIHIVGTIVEPPCDISTQSQQVTAHCFRQGQQHTLTLSTLTQQHALPQGVGYIAPISLSDTVKVVVISYQ